MSSWIRVRNIHSVLLRSDRGVFRLTPPKSIRSIATHTKPAVVGVDGGKAKWERPVAWVLAGAFVTVASVGSSHVSGGATTTSLDALGTLPLGPPTLISGASTAQAEDLLVRHTSDYNHVEEPETGIKFPPSFQSKQLLGLGVRKKYQVFNVYAVGFYVNREDFRGLPQDQQEDALLNPQKPRTIRIVMNRTLTMDKVISTLIQSLEPRMHGRDMFALEHFAKLREYGCLQKGDEIILSIQGPVLECKCSNGGHNMVESEVFTRAVCDVYFGKDPISPAAKGSVMMGMDSL